MLKPNYKKLGLMAFAGFMAVGAIAPVTSVHAQGEPEYTGTTTVSFDNRTLVPGGADYGFIIPTAITLTGDLNKEKDVSIAVTGVNGFDLKEWSLLEIQASVASKNTYKMLLGGTDAAKTASYQLKYLDKTEKTFNSDTCPKVGTFYGISNNLGVGAGMVDTVKGTAKLTDKSKATVKGNYSDTLTYHFKEIKNVKK